MKRAVFRTVLILAVVVFLLTAAASAMSVLSLKAYCESGYTVRDGDILSPDASDGKFYPFPDFSENGNWTCTGMISNSFVHNSGGVRYYCANLKRDTESVQRTGGVTFTFDLSEEKIDTSDYGALRFAVGIRGGDSSGKGYYVSTYTVTSEMTSAAQTCVGGAASSSELSLVSVDLSSVEGELLSVRIVIHYNGEKIPAGVRISSPFLEKGDGGFLRSEKYLTAVFSSENGSISMDTGEVVTDRNGDATLVGYYAGQFRDREGKAYLLVKTDGIKSGGIQASITYCESDTGNIITESSPRISIVLNENEHVFPFDVKGSIMYYTIDFLGVSSDESVYLTGVELFVGTGMVPTKSIGKVSLISFDGETVRFSGSVERDFAKANYDGEIGFFAISSENDLAQAVSLGSIEITTKFDYTADLTDISLSADTYKFLAAVISANGEITPISAPRYFDADTTEYDSGPKLGVCDTPAVSAFESNASHIIIDVPLDKLLSPDAEKTVDMSFVAYGVPDGEKDYSSRTVSLDRKLLGELDGDVNFCLSAGMKVYLRFISDTPIDGLTFAGANSENYAVDPKDPEGRQLYAALVRFFAKRYGELDGFVIGRDAASDLYTGTSILSSPAGYIDALADVCRITYNACSSLLKNPVIVVPLSERGDFSATTTAVMLADRLDDIGDIPLALMYRVSEFTSENGNERMNRAVAEMGYSSLVCSMILCETDEEKLLADYSAELANGQNGQSFAEYAASRIGTFCAEQSKTDAVFISLEGTELGNGRALYSILKRLSDSGTTVESLSCAETDGEVTGGIYDLWDFGDKFYDLGWIAIGVNSCISDYQSLSGDTVRRCLSASFDKGENGAAGILLCNFDETVDLTKAEKLCFTLAAGGNSENPISMVFIVGTDEARAEYLVDVAADGRKKTLTCDLTTYGLRDKVDFIGVMVYSDGEAEIEIEKVSIMSDSADSDELGAIFAPKDNEQESKIDGTFMLIVAGVGLIFTLSVFFALFRREREGAEGRRNDTAGVNRREKIK